MFRVWRFFVNNSNIRLVLHTAKNISDYFSFFTSLAFLYYSSTMSITYEEALSTLESMFGENWSRDDLDVVLRHKNGHMENTVDMILRHSDKDPQTVIQQLEQGIDPDQQASEMDAQLARQLASSGGRGSRSGKASNPAVVNSDANGRVLRGTPIQLPEDFLRLPGMATATNSQTAEDEKLARMLQDELFTEELRNNPEFAHLGRGSRRPTAANNRTNVTAARARGGDPSLISPNFMKQVADLGDNARRRLQMLAAQFNARNPATANNQSAEAASPERRGLLDNDDYDDMELAARKDL